MDNIIRELKKQNDKIDGRLVRWFIRKCEELGIDWQEFDLVSLDWNDKDGVKREMVKFLKEYGYVDKSKKDIEDEEREFIKRQLEYERELIEKELEEKKKELLKQHEPKLEKYYRKLYDVLDTFLKSDEVKGCIIIGNSGYGKTFNITNYFEKKNIKTHVIRGRITAKMLYKQLYNHRNGIIIFDDVVNLFNDDNAVNILLGALDKDGKVSWQTAHNTLEQEGILDEFNFEGKMIFIMNYFDETDEVMLALKQRCVRYELKFTRKELLEMMYILAKRDGVDFAVVDWLKDNKVCITLRDYNLLKDIYLNFKKDWEYRAKLLFELDIELDEIDKEIVRLFNEHPEMSNNERANRIHNELGIHRSTFYRRLNKLRKLGVISK